MKQPTCPNPDCHSTNTRAFGSFLGREPKRLEGVVYIQLQCNGCGEIFQVILRGE